MPANSVFSDFQDQVIEFLAQWIIEEPHLDQKTISAMILRLSQPRKCLFDYFRILFRRFLPSMEASSLLAVSVHI